ncbi:hypothetical protein ACFX10_038528 [Malus domestica]
MLSREPRAMSQESMHPSVEPRNATPHGVVLVLRLGPVNHHLGHQFGVVQTNSNDLQSLLIKFVAEISLKSLLSLKFRFQSHGVLFGDVEVIPPPPNDGSQVNHRLKHHSLTKNTAT